jgi:hypothetical protein
MVSDKPRHFNGDLYGHLWMVLSRPVIDAGNGENEGRAVSQDAVF